MKLSVSAWCVQEKLFKGTMSLSDFITLCHENGVKYVELLDCFWKGDGSIDECIDLLKKYDMEVSAYSIGNDFVQEDAAERKAQIDMVKHGVDIACRLNAKFLRIFSGSQKKGITFETAREWIVDGLKQCAAAAEEKGVTMVLENHGLFAGKGSQVKGLIEEVGSGYLKANTDIGNFLLVNDNPLEAVKTLNNKVGFVHFKDFKEVSEAEPGYEGIDGRRFQGTVLGDGIVEMKEVVDYLYSIGYDGYLSIEFEGVGDPVTGTLASIEYTKSIIR